MEEHRPLAGDDPKWSSDEKSIADALCKQGLEVMSGRENDGRHPDFMINGLAADGKTLGKGTGSGTMANRAREVVRKRQARIIVFDNRIAGIPEEEARRGIRRIAGAWGSNGHNVQYLDRIIVIGNGYFLDEVI